MRTLPSVLLVACCLKLFSRGGKLQASIVFCPQFQLYFAILADLRNLGGLNLHSNCPLRCRERTRHVEKHREQTSSLCFGNSVMQALRRMSVAGKRSVTSGAIRSTARGLSCVSGRTCSASSSVQPGCTTASRTTSATTHTSSTANQMGRVVQVPEITMFTENL